MEKTMVIWRKLGKEHDERGTFRVNRREVVSACLQEQADRFRKLPEPDWRWWQVSEDVIVEKPFGDARAMYHLPRRKWVVVEDAQIQAPGFGEEWTWYVHIGDITYDPAYSSWVFTDHFCDVIVHSDLRTHTVLDLDDLGIALEMKLITPQQASEILAQTQKLVHMIRLGGFPPGEVCEVRSKIEDFGWDRRSD